MAAVFPTFALVSAKVPVVAGLWQSKVHVTVQALGNFEADRFLLPVPVAEKNCFGVTALVSLLGLLDFDDAPAVAGEHASPAVTRSATLMAGTIALFDRDAKRAAPSLSDWVRRNFIG